jgi:hypothetical protein
MPPATHAAPGYRTKTLGVKLTPVELHRVRTRARRAGLTDAEYARRVLTEGRAVKGTVRPASKRGASVPRAARATERDGFLRARKRELIAAGLTVQQARARAEAEADAGR